MKKSSDGRYRKIRRERVNTDRKEWKRFHHRTVYPGRNIKGDGAHTSTKASSTRQIKTKLWGTWWELVYQGMLTPSSHQTAAAIGSRWTAAGQPWPCSLAVPPRHNQTCHQDYALSWLAEFYTDPSHQHVARLSAGLACEGHMPTCPRSEAHMVALSQNSVCS